MKFTDLFIQRPAHRRHAQPDAGLDGGERAEGCADRRRARAATGFDHVRVERSLNQELDIVELGLLGPRDALHGDPALAHQRGCSFR